MVTAAQYAQRELIDPFMYAPAPLLTQVNGLSSEYHGQIIQGLDIWCDANPIILEHEVTLRDCRIRYMNGSALQASVNAANSKIYNIDVGHIALPTSPTLPVLNRESFIFDEVEGLFLSRIKFRGGNLPIRATDCNALRIELIAARNIYGYGLFELINCPDVNIENFSLINDLVKSYAEDLIKLDASHGAQIRRGLLDGSNSVEGFCLNFSGSHDCHVEDVDVMHIGNGQLIDRGFNNKFINVRYRDQHLTGQGERNDPEATDLFNFDYDDADTQTGSRFERVKYYNIPAIVSEADLPDPDLHEYVDVIEEDFTPNSEIALSWQWEDPTQGPYSIALIKPNGMDGMLIELDYDLGTVIAHIIAESSIANDDLTFSIVADPHEKFEIVDDYKLATRSNFDYDAETQHSVTIRVENTTGGSFERTFLLEVASGVGTPVVNIDLEFDALEAEFVFDDADLPDFVIGKVFNDFTTIYATAYMGNLTDLGQLNVFDFDDITLQSYIAINTQNVIITAQFAMESMTIAQQHAFNFTPIAAQAYINTYEFINFSFNGFTAQFDVQTFNILSVSSHFAIPEFMLQAYVTPFYSPKTIVIEAQFSLGTFNLDLLQKNILPNRIDATTTIFTPAVRGLVRPSLLAATTQIFSPTVQRGNVNISPSLLAAATVFYGPTVIRGNVTISPLLLAATTTVFSPTVTTGGVTVSPSLLASTTSVFAPVVTPNINVSPDFVDSVEEVFEPTVSN